MSSEKLRVKRTKQSHFVHVTLEKAVTIFVCRDWRGQESKHNLWPIYNVSTKACNSYEKRRWCLCFAVQETDFQLLRKLGKQQGDDVRS